MQDLRINCNRFGYLENVQNFLAIAPPTKELSALGLLRRLAGASGFAEENWRAFSAHMPS